MSDTPNEDRYLVPGLVRGLAVLKLFTPERPALSLSEIAAILGITRSAAFRTVYTLAETGCLLHDDRAQCYTLGPGVLRLTYGYVATREIVEIAQPELERLRERLGWSAHLGVLDGASVLYVLRVTGAQRDVSIVQVGSRLPARSTTLGRVLLASLAPEEIIAMYRPDAVSGGKTRGKGPQLPAILRQAEQDGACDAVIHRGEFEAGMLSAAAAIRDMTGRVVAAINVTAVHAPETLQQLESAVRGDLIATAARISKLLGWEPPQDAPAPAPA
jgi:DNA-binding IclR family transcriptional regulator